jgi:hypothetical protein
MRRLGWNSPYRILHALIVRGKHTFMKNKVKEEEQERASSPTELEINEEAISLSDLSKNQNVFRVDDRDERPSFSETGRCSIIDSRICGQKNVEVAAAQQIIGSPYHRSPVRALMRDLQPQAPISSGGRCICGMVGSQARNQEWEEFQVVSGESQVLQNRTSSCW